MREQYLGKFYHVNSTNNATYIYQETPTSDKALWGIARGQARRQDGGVMFLNTDKAIVPLSINLIYAYDDCDSSEKETIRRTIIDEMKQSTHLIVQKDLKLPNVPAPIIQFINDGLANLDNL